MYQFTETNGRFTYEKTPVNRALQEKDDQLFYLRQLEQRVDVVCMIVIGVVFCLACAVPVWLGAFIAPEGLGFPFGLLVTAGSLALCVWLSNRLRRMPKRSIDDGRMEGLVERVRDLQGKLAELHGDRPSPLRQESQGKTVFSELSRSMSEEEVGESVRELQSRVFVVSDEGS